MATFASSPSPVIVKNLIELGFQEIDAELLGALAPLALGRYFNSPMEEFRDVTFMDSIEVPANGDLPARKLRLDQIAFYRFIFSIGVGALEEGVLTKDEFFLVAMLSPENKVLNSMLREKRPLNGLVLGPLRAPRLKLEWIKLLK